MPEKAIYSLTADGEKEFERLMTDISCSSVNIFLDFNAVVVNLESVSKEMQRKCIENIATSIEELKLVIENNINAKKDRNDIPITGMAVLRQQYALTLAIEDWISEIRNNL